MTCPHCQSPRIRKLNRTTDLGYAVFRCPDCRRKCNERTGTPFNYLEFPTDIVFEIVLCRLLYKLSLRNLAQSKRPAPATLTLCSASAERSSLRG
jgi:putative transposase